MVLAVALPALAVIALAGGGLAMVVVGFVADRPVLGWAGVVLVAVSVLSLIVLRRTSGTGKTGR
jgi:hypothetical protein